ncbi:MAG: diacylglycerol kinase family lipid kinase [Tannerella sp.]|jgi:YegS/Rv2252/BmrU family lipid kinase|nr:diacylglycerol kinase family lipid kinase [Tannerella sp.]
MGETREQPIRIQAIINPISGIGSKRKVPLLLETAFKKEEGYLLSIAFTQYAGHASLLTVEALKEGAKYILAVGGDGTVNEVASAMLYSEATLGIIPKGSGNGLARELRLPLDAKRAVDIIAEGFEQPIDACEANGSVFFTTCGVGFDAVVSRKFATEKRRGSLSYVKSAIEEYLAYKPEVYALSIGEQCFREEAFLVACANASQYGYNAYIAPHASLTDGLMDITVLTPFTPLDVPQIALQLFTRTIDKNSRIRTFQTERLTIDRQKPGVMHLDGTPIETGEHIEIHILPKALKVLVPKNPSPRQDARTLFGQVTGFFEKGRPYWPRSK